MAATPIRNNNEQVVIFDEVCVLCENSVRFIIQRDKQGQFKFAAAQSASGMALQKRYAIDAMQSNTMVLIKRDKVYTASDAALEIAKDLDGLWSMFSVLRVVPRSLRDRVYLFIANNRYTWFGRKTHCLILDAEMAKRFL